jgi:hypothetical protein
MVEPPAATSWRRSSVLVYRERVGNTNELDRDLVFGLEAISHGEYHERSDPGDRNERDQRYQPQPHLIGEGQRGRKEHDREEKERPDGPAREGVDAGSGPQHRERRAVEHHRRDRRRCRRAVDTEAG